MHRLLRQGDPLSPFLFVLVVEVFNKMVGKAMENGLVEGLCVGKEKVELSLLHFVDDTILFCPVNELAITNYVRQLRCFAVMSRLTINCEKYSMIPINCQTEWVSDLQRKLGCEVVSLPFKYLGIMVGENPKRIKTW